MSGKHIAVYPGSFDPVHNGHLDIIYRCQPLFDELVIAVLGHDEKQPLFSVAERVDMIRQQVQDLDNCRVESFTGLLVDFMEKAGSQVAVRGLRAVSDFEYEVQMALMNRRLKADTETAFLASKEEYGYLSSRLLKEVFFLGGEVKGLVPESVLRRLEEKRGVLDS